jgi:hypothetical protein
LVRKKEGADVEVFTALSKTVETGMERVSFDVISTLHSQISITVYSYALTICVCPLCAVRGRFRP